MTYKIVWWKDARVITARPWDDLPGAIAHAKDHFPFRRGADEATSVEVVAQDDTVVFSLESDTRH